MHLACFVLNSKPARFNLYHYYYSHYQNYHSIISVIFCYKSVFNPDSELIASTSVSIIIKISYIFFLFLHSIIKNISKKGRIAIGNIVSRSKFPKINTGKCNFCMYRIFNPVSLVFLLKFSHFIIIYVFGLC